MRFLLAILLVCIAWTARARPAEEAAVSSGNEWQNAWKNFREGFRNVGQWFVRQYRSVQNWFASSKQELEKKVQDMVGFLGQVKDNANNLVQGANQRMRDGLNNVAGYYNDVVAFQQKVRTDTAASFAALEEEWKNKVQNMYNGGLDVIVEAANSAKVNNPATMAPSTNSSA